MRRNLPYATVAASAGLSVLLTAASGSDTFSLPAVPLAGRHLPEISALRDGRSAERFLGRGDDHRYRIALKAGESLRVVVEQRGVDVAVQTMDSAGALVAEFDDEVQDRGEELVDLVADAAGLYTVRVRPSALAVGAGRYAIRLASRRPATDSDRSMQQSRRLRTAAAALDAAGRFADARPLLEDALALSERVKGAADPDAGRLQLQLALNALATRDHARAKHLDERAMAIFDEAGAPEQPYSAKARSLLALIDEHAGQGPRAEALVRQALAVLERTVGTDHRWYAQCLTTHAALRLDAGDFDTAEALALRARSILERNQDVDGAPYVAVLNNLGEVYWRTGDNARAEELFRASLVRGERLEGAESYRVSVSLQNLGIVARAQGDFTRALDADQRALSMRQRILGADHADIAPLLNNIANVYHDMGDDGRSLSALYRALDIREKTVGPYHRGTLNAVGNIARTYASMGEVSKAIAFERRADAIVEKQLALNLSVGSERQKLAFVRSVAERTDRTISLHLREAPGDAEAASLAALVLLQRKGRVQDAMADAFAAVRHRIARADDRTLLDHLNETRTELAELALNPPDAMAAAERERRLAELEGRKEQLEATLSERSAAFRAEAQPVTLEAVQAALPERAALIELGVYRPFDFHAKQNADRYGPPRYAAYVVRRHGAARGVDLGDARVMDQSIDALRNALRDPASADVRARAREVERSVLEPLRPALAGVTRLIVSPDGHFNFVPFEALLGEDGRYLVEHYAMSYVTSGRDLLRMQVPRGMPNGSVIVANPLFGEPDRAAALRPVSTAALGAGARDSVTSPADLAAVYFAPLSATGLEAREIKTLFPDATLLTGGRATKAAVQQVKAPLILHIASHGFFLDDPLPGDAESNANGNPLLRSGLAFAGANLSGDGHVDGILTALEASGLDLWGTRLVTLSACDTGVGEIRNGEGVYGLRRAFVLAGAETLVMSLWPVSDYVARETMVAYYTGLRGGLGRGDALRQAKLAMLKRANRQHPYYWAGFIQSGEWADLDGRR